MTLERERSSIPRMIPPYILLTLLILTCAVRPALACGGTVLTPFCGKTLVLSLGSDELLLTGGGTVGLPSLVYFSIGDVPPGSGLCPPGPYDIDLELTAACDAGPAAGPGSLLGEPLVFGFNPYDVPFTLPAGPPRFCTLTGTATTLLGDGMELTQISDTVLCVGDPAPGNPTLPRLDFELLSDPLQQVHPGDQASHLYRITNNDPLESYSGMLVVELANTSRMPGSSGPMPPGTGVYSVSDPLAGDNFPIAFGGDLDDCLPLPADPLDPAIPTLILPIELLPLEFIEFDLVSRPWGMCANGSCGRAKLAVDGSFSDTTRGIACSGFVTAADTAQPPSYAWPTAGQAVLFPPTLDPQQPFLVMDVEPVPGLGALVDLQMLPPQLLIDGNPPPQPPQPLFLPIDDNWARGQMTFPGIPPFPADSFFDLTYQMQLQPNPDGPPVQIDLVSMDLVGNAPGGFGNLQPFGMGELLIQAPGSPQPYDGLVQLFAQMSIVGIDDVGEHRQLVLDLVEMQPLPGGGGFAVHLAGTLEPGPGNQIQAIELRQDFRGFASAQGSFIFKDGFESEDLSRWTRSVGGS